MTSQYNNVVPPSSSMRKGYGYFICGVDSDFDIANAIHEIQNHDVILDARVSFATDANNLLYFFDSINRLKKLSINLSNLSSRNVDDICDFIRKNNTISKISFHNNFSSFNNSCYNDNLWHALRAVNDNRNIISLGVDYNNAIKFVLMDNTNITKLCIGVDDQCVSELNPLPCMNIKCLKINIDADTPTMQTCDGNSNWSCPQAPS